MSDFINNTLYIDNKDNWAKATKNFSKNSINSLFDVNEDGEFSAVEKDRAESIALFNSLSSISPVVARAYNDINFQINNGSYLTKQQLNNSKKFYNAIQQAIEMDERDTIIPHHINPEAPDEYFSPIDTNLSEDLKQRQFLSQAELLNDP